MAEHPVTIGELDRRTQERHVENQRTLAGMNETLCDLRDRVGAQNGRITRLEVGAAVAEAHRQADLRMLGEVKAMATAALEDVKELATQAASEAARDAARVAVVDALPGSKQVTLLSAAAAGVTTGGIVGVWKVGQALVEWLGLLK
jgi:hypothetical protein